MKCKQAVYPQNNVEKIRIKTDCCNFFSFVQLNDTILACSGILGGRNLVRVRHVVVSAIFDFMTVEDWGE